MRPGTRANATAASAGTRKRATWQAKGCAASCSGSFVADAGARRVSAVIACYKDAQAIPLMYERLTAVFVGLAVDHEIIFVNDGSPDDTGSVLKDLTAKDHRVLAIEHPRNFGSQNAFLSGIQ